ncbi:MAG: hypothetical protein H7Z15_05735 [Rhizobacter sp.]|nr:hypothetical protein [Rhizobacter sp.]
MRLLLCGEEQCVACRTDGIALSPYLRLIAMNAGGGFSVNPSQTISLPLAAPWPVAKDASGELCRGLLVALVVGSIIGSGISGLPPGCQVPVLLVK